jgi:tRNA G46 methylase TrmB
MVLGEVSNLAVIGGDAAQILPAHFARGSVDHICINFPEPPHHSGDDAAESQFHLLTASFFRDMHRVLAPSGKITVFSDNRKYCQVRDGHRRFFASIGVFC